MLIDHAGVDRDFSLRAFELYLYAMEPATREHVIVSDLQFRRVVDSERDMTPIVIKDAAVQQIMDDLWNLGVRPTRDVDMKTVIDAKDDHVRDLRDVVHMLNQNVTTLIGGKGDNETK